MKSLIPPEKPTRSAGGAHRHVLLAQSWWEDRVLQGVARYATEHDWVLNCRMRWTHSLPRLDELVCDGIIANTGVTHPMHDLIQFVRQAEVPVVDIQASDGHLLAPKVVVPHEEIGQAGARHLISLGFQNLGFVVFEDNVIEQDRCLGFRKTVLAAGCRFHAILYEEIGQKLHGFPKPLGLMAANDLNALTVISTIRDHGFFVPEEVAVVGVDDTEIMCDLAPVQLSSVNCSFEKQGYEAAALLDRLMNGEAPPKHPIIISPQGVTVRRSTDTIAIPDLNAARVLRFLRDHHSEPILIKSIRAEVTGSLRHVQNLFRKYVGRTMAQELVRLRVEHARDLLVDPKLKIETIATDCGFASRFHFMRSFQRLTGQSPSVYRRKIAIS